MRIKSPKDFQPSAMPRERGRVDVIALGRDYAPDRNEAMLANLHMSGDVMLDALAMLEFMIRMPKATLIFANAEPHELGAVAQYLQEKTRLDVRFGTIGYNGTGLTFYK